MNESLHNLATIRQYLLGKISDEKILEGIEELLFLDEDFCTKTEIVEDELINDFVFGKLSDEDKLSFEKTLENNSDRRAKVKVTQLLKEKIADSPIEEKVSFFDSIKAFFRQPIYAGGLALLLIAILIGAILLSRSPNNTELAELKNIYQKNRPTESRISEFDYAPYEVTRGEENLSDAEKRKLKIIENDLLKRVDSNPNANNHNALGIFYLSQRKYSEAIKELEESVKLEPNNAKFHNDLGSAYFETAKNSEKDKKFINLNQANEEFSKALELNPNLLDALFNKSLSLQEIGLYAEAKKSWEAYLQKDSASKWADEARKNLEKISQIQSGLNKKKEDVLNDFLTAYRSKDEKTIWKIHNSTKGLFTEISLSEQLTIGILNARKKNDEKAERENIEALEYIGKLEKAKHADFFLADLAEFYKQLDDVKVGKILEAKSLIQQGRQNVNQTLYTESIRNFEKAKEIYLQIGNKPETIVAEVWFGQMLRDVGKFGEAETKLSILADSTEKKNYKTVQSTALDWLANAEGGKKNISKLIILKKKSMEIAENTENIYEIRQNAQGLASAYLEIGEIEKAAAMFNKALESSNAYFLSFSQMWRNILYGARFSKRLKNTSTNIDFSKENVAISQERFANQIQVINNSVNQLTSALAENRQFEEALKLAAQSIKKADGMPDSDEKILIQADAFLSRANLQSKMKNCEAAIGDYNKSLELYSQKKESIFSLYDIHKGKLLCFQAQNQLDDFEKELTTVLEFSEQYRQNIREDKFRQAFFNNEQTVYDSAVSNALTQKNPAKAFDLLETTKSRSLLDFVKSQKSLTEIEKDFDNISKPYTLQQIQEQLPENVQILEYSFLPNKIGIWLFTKNDFEYTEKQISAEQFEQKINEYQKAIIAKENPESIKKTAQEIYAKLIPHNLKTNKILCLIPDKSLWRIPFSSLISENGKYLIEDFSILFSPSSSVFVSITKNTETKGESEKLLSIGNPKFDFKENPNLPNLPDAEIEAEEIARNYQLSQIITDTEATKSSFFEKMENAEIIHFAGHFVVNPDDSAKSRMIFADSDLFTFELSERKLRKSKLVVLSACETGIETVNNSEGPIGAARTFLAMGTPLVIASNWKVDSAATKNLMISFHQKRKVEKLSSIEALRQAQLKMLKTQDFMHPYYWSAFSINGGLANY